MRVLHLFSNYKFTGPADPALDLARALSDAGLEIVFAAGRSPEPDNPASVGALARDRGLTVNEDLRLPKHGHPLSILRDVGSLRRLQRATPFDIIHCHLASDHFTAAWALCGEVPLVRTVYDAEPPSGWRARHALRRTRGLLVYSEAVASRLGEDYPQLRAEVRVTSPSIDLLRFSRPRNEDIRRRWGAGPDDIVIGVVARMQTHRLFPELIEGFAQVARDDERLRLVVLGRGTNRVRVAHEPARNTGLGDRIVFPGYVDPAEYPSAVPGFDALVFLVPGSDGTCRAAREALTCGVPVIASRRGLLPSFVVPEQNGLLLAADTPEAIARCIERVASDEELRGQLARGAREYARTHFDLHRQVEIVQQLYSEVTTP